MIIIIHILYENKYVHGTSGVTEYEELLAMNRRMHFLLNYGALIILNLECNTPNHIVVIVPTRLSIEWVIGTSLIWIYLGHIVQRVMNHVAKS